MDRNDIALRFFGMHKDLRIGRMASGIAGGIFFFDRTMRRTSGKDNPRSGRRRLASGPL
jgi:hypothetical protein